MLLVGLMNRNLCGPCFRFFNVMHFVLCNAGMILFRPGLYHIVVHTVYN